MALPLEYLRELGVLPAAAVTAPEGSAGGTGGRLSAFLLVERNCRDTVLDYEPAARLVLEGIEGHGGPGLERLQAADVTAFLVRECAWRSVSGARDLVCALRSFLRYLHLAGLIELRWWGRSRGRGPARSDAPTRAGAGGGERLLASCDRRRTIGRRDYAILLLLARLGLRAGEVAAITLDDLDWRTGCPRSRQGGREDLLPLPVDVGEAIVV